VCVCVCVRVCVRVCVPLAGAGGAGAIGGHCRPAHVDRVAGTGRDARGEAVLVVLEDSGLPVVGAQAHENVARPRRCAFEHFCRRAGSEPQTFPSFPALPGLPTNSATHERGAERGRTRAERGELSSTPIGWGAAMPAGKKKAAEAKVKTEPADEAAGVKRERPAEEAEGGAAAKHVKAEPKAEPHRSGAAARRGARGAARALCLRPARGARACAARGGGRRAAQQQRSSAQGRARAPGAVPRTALCGAVWPPPAGRAACALPHADVPVAPCIARAVLAQGGRRRRGRRRL